MVSSVSVLRMKFTLYRDEWNRIGSRVLKVCTPSSPLPSFEGRSFLLINEVYGNKRSLTATVKKHERLNRS